MSDHQDSHGSGEALPSRMQEQIAVDPRLAALLEHSDVPFTWQTDLLTMFSVIGCVQLAMRHPNLKKNDDEGARIAEAFVRSVQEQIGRFDVRLASLIEDGFRPECDLGPMGPDGTNAEVTVPRIVEYVEGEERILHEGEAMGDVRSEISEPELNSVPIAAVMVAVDEAVRNAALHVGREIYEARTAEAVVNDFIDALSRHSRRLGFCLAAMIRTRQAEASRGDAETQKGGGT